MDSIWLKDSKKGNYPSLKGSATADILIIGGGISGISLAYELATSGKKIILVEQNELYHSTTGLTTGKLTFQHGYKYQKLIDKYGPNKAKNYYKSNVEALKRIKEIIDNHNIDCDYIVCNHSLFANKNSKALLKEKEAYEKINIPFKEQTINNRYYLTVKDQAVFNVVKYLDGILKFLRTCKNIEIYENTRVKKVKLRRQVKICSGDEFTIKVKIVVFASMYPRTGFFNLYFCHLKPVLSFACLTNIDEDISEAGIREDEPAFSFRPYQKGKMLIVGESCDASLFPAYRKEKELVDEAKKLFNAEGYYNSWVNQDYDPLDELPLIGRVKKNVYIMTGYNKWGLTTAILASNIIADLIIKGHSEYEQTFSPKRCTSLGKKIMYVLSNPALWIKSRFKGTKKTCTHLHCGLRYNPVTDTYDCPCHGSRFSKDGTVITGPARKNIKKK